MTKPMQTWREKRLVREDGSTSSSDDHDEFEAGEGSGTKNDNETISQPTLDIKMVFVLPEEFHAPDTGIVELCAGVKRAVFEKPARPRKTMKALYIKGHFDGMPVGWMMVDRGRQYIASSIV
jgi:hypothetical protein